MMTTEVTQGMWESVMGISATRQIPEDQRHAIGTHYPIYYVSWQEAIEFTNRLNLRDPGKNYRLPTEAEWEYACRAGTTTPYWSGETEADLSRAAWYEGNSNHYAHPVGERVSNPWGLYDMHGNIEELCYDYLDHNYYERRSNNKSNWPTKW